MGKEICYTCQPEMSARIAEEAFALIAQPKEERDQALQGN